MCPPGVLQHISPSLMRPCETVSGQGTTEERGLSSPCTIKSLVPLCSLCERAVPQPCRKGARCYLQNTISSTYKHLSPLSSSYSHLKTCSTPASGPLTLLSFTTSVVPRRLNQTRASPRLTPAPGTAGWGCAAGTHAARGVPTEGRNSGCTLMGGCREGAQYTGAQGLRGGEHPAQGRPRPWN